MNNPVVNDIQKRQNRLIYAPDMTLTVSYSEADVTTPNSYQPNGSLQVVAVFTINNVPYQNSPCWVQLFQDGDNSFIFAESIYSAVDSTTNPKQKPYQKTTYNLTYYLVIAIGSSFGLTASDSIDVTVMFGEGGPSGPIDGDPFKIPVTVVSVSNS